MVPKDIFVVGASAGGVEALRTLVSGLPHNFPGSLLIILHVGERSLGLLPEILVESGPLPAKHPKDGEVILPGQI